MIEKARSVGDTPEGRALRKKAEERLREAGLTEADVGLRDRLVARGRIRIWEQALLESVAMISGCGLQHRKIEGLWMVVGSSLATERAERLISSIRGQMAIAADAYGEELRELGAESKSARAARLAFLEAATIPVAIRLMALSTEEEASPEGEEEVDQEVPPKRSPDDLLGKKLEEASDRDFDLPAGARHPVEAGLEAGGEVSLDAWDEEIGVRRMLTGEVRP